MEILFKTRNQKQLVAARAWVDDYVDEILYGGAKGGGKSFLGASLIFGNALMYPGTHYFIARKELNDLRKFTIPTIYEVIRVFGLDHKQYVKYNGQDSFFEVYGGEDGDEPSKVFLIACKEEPSDPLFERFGSMQNTQGWIEEAGEVAEAAKSNLKLSIGRWKNEEYDLKGKMLITANPKKGWLKREFVDPFAQGMLEPTKVYIQAFATDNPYLPGDYLKTLSNEKDRVRRQRLWEGRWDYDDDADSLVSFDALTDAFTNAVDESDQRFLIVDVARYGKDSIVYSFWKGAREYKRVVKTKQGTHKTIQDIRDFARDERIPFSHILIDEDGIGGGVVDGLPGVKGFTGNSTPIPTAAQIREKQDKVDHFLVPKTTFANLKAQCGWKIAEMINEHEIALLDDSNRERMTEDLDAILRDGQPDGDGRKKLRAKDEAKKELGRSPDLGDTVLMRAYFELIEESVGNTHEEEAAAAEEQAVHFRRVKHRRHLNSAE